MYCPFRILREFLNVRPNFRNEHEPFFIFSDGEAVNPNHINTILKLILNHVGFNEKLYSMHGFRAGRTLDLFKAGLLVKTIKKIGRWKSNAVYKYLNYE